MSIGLKSDLTYSERDTYNDYQNDKDKLNTFITSPLDTSNNSIIMGDGSIINSRGMVLSDGGSDDGKIRVLGDRLLFYNDQNESFPDIAITSKGITVSDSFKFQNGSGSVVIDKNKITTTNMYLDMTANSGQNHIYIDPVKGIQIKKGATETLKIDTNGNIVMTGTLNACSIEGGTITIGSGNNVFKADATNGISLGHATPSLAPLQIKQSGELIANKATIKGDITSGSTITGATINGGTITGNTISGSTITGSQIEGTNIILDANDQSQGIEWKDKTNNTKLAEIFTETDSLNIENLGNHINLYCDSLNLGGCNNITGLQIRFS